MWFWSAYGLRKSSVGKLLASRLRRPFLDLDEVIEAEAGQPVDEIFRLQGEVAFRAKERAALRRVVAGESNGPRLGWRNFFRPFESRSAA